MELNIVWGYPENRSGISPCFHFQFMKAHFLETLLTKIVIFPCFQPQFRGRTEIAPDEREKFLQRYQHHLQQQGQANLPNIMGLAGGKQYSAQQQNPLLQQVIVFFIFRNALCPLLCVWHLHFLWWLLFRMIERCTATMISLSCIFHFVVKSSS